jgi:hypothetical protein
MPFSNEFRVFCVTEHSLVTNDSVRSYVGLAKLHECRYTPDVPDDVRPQEAARRAGRLAAQLAARLAGGDQEQAARLGDDYEREASIVENRLETAGQTEQEVREARRTVPMSFALRGDLKERLGRFREQGGTINVSGIANEAIERELDRLESGNSVVQRLRVELTERRGPSWTMGFQAGRKWAEDVASWLEITEYAVRYAVSDVKVQAFYGDDPEMYVAFSGSFSAPERDYGRDMPGEHGAPSFKFTTDDGQLRHEYRTYELEAYWRAWLQAVKLLYVENEAKLPSVIDQLSAVEATEQPRDVDPDDIPF